MPLISHKLRALSQTRAAQWRSANVPPAFQKRAWAGSLAFSIQSPPRDCLTKGSSPLAHGLGRGCGRQLLDQIGLGPLPEEPRALVGCEAHAGALPLGAAGQRNPSRWRERRSSASWENTARRAVRSRSWCCWFSACSPGSASTHPVLRL